MDKLNAEDQRLLGRCEEGIKGMQEAVKEITREVKEHGIQLAKGEKNFDTLREDVSKLEGKLDETGRNIVKITESVSDLVAEFKACRQSKNINNTCEIAPLPPREKTSAPAIIINIPKFDCSFLRSPIIYIVTALSSLLTAAGCKWGGDLLHAILRIGGNL